MPQETSPSIGVIGTGPGGLSAAMLLAKSGARVTMRRAILDEELNRAQPSSSPLGPSTGSSSPGSPLPSATSSRPDSCHTIN